MHKIEALRPAPHPQWDNNNNNKWLGDDNDHGVEAPCSDAEPSAELWLGLGGRRSCKGAAGRWKRLSKKVGWWSGPQWLTMKPFGPSIKDSIA